MKNSVFVFLITLISTIFTSLILFLMDKGEAEVIVGSPYQMTPGVVESYAGNEVPSGYLLCDGRAVSRTTYANLFAAIGTTYGVGDGNTTFNLPDLRGKVATGKSSNTFTTLGETGGSINNTLISKNLPSHNHEISTLSGTTSSNGAHTHSIPALSGTAVSAGTHSHNFGYGSGEYGYFYGADFAGDYINFFHGNATSTLEVSIASAGAHTHSVTTTASTTGSKGNHTHVVTTTAATSGSTGTATDFTNLQPYIVTNYIIKY